jgi:hypothetical protein
MTHQQEELAVVVAVGLIMVVLVVDVECVEVEMVKMVQEQRGLMLQLTLVEVVAEALNQDLVNSLATMVAQA